MCYFLLRKKKKKNSQKAEPKAQKAKLRAMRELYLGTETQPRNLQYFPD